MVVIQCLMIVIMTFVCHLVHLRVCRGDDVVGVDMPTAAWPNNN